MRLGGRIAAAIEILEQLEAQKRPVGHILKEWGHAHRFAGSGDRAAIANLVYDALRFRRSVAAHMGDDSARAAIFAVLHRDSAYLNGEALDFTDDPHAPAALSEAESAALADDPALVLEDATPADAANCPDWLWPMMERVFGAQTGAQVGAMAARAPLDLRLNPSRSKPERVDKALSRFSVERSDIFPQLRRIAPAGGFKRAPHIASDEAFQKGWIEVQDAGSQLAAEIAIGDTKPRTVLDLCAGAGGKALALSTFMGGRGQVFAHDIDRRRMADLWPRIKRAGVHNIQVIEPDGLIAHEVVANGVDCVLVDAPCTGSGTWRRHPDTKWRVTPAALEARMGEQDMVLAKAAPLVKTGGRLVYVTCSLIAEENEDRLLAFLAVHQEFEPIAAAELIAGLGRDAVPAYLPSVDTGEFSEGALGLRLTPKTSQTDGFFIAGLKRRHKA